jgi:hypothetical protein
VASAAALGVAYYAVPAIWGGVSGYAGGSTKEQTSTDWINALAGVAVGVGTYVGASRLLKMI